MPNKRRALYYVLCVQRPCAQDRPRDRGCRSDQSGPIAQKLLGGRSRWACLSEVR
ncbi:unnamed protein product [Amoebophrya sp. A120]|nr:unnamed protein product [Amoebophrya sp. A120]|eukprot:GSA120T00019276001.1